MFQNIIHCNSHCNLLHISGLIQPANSRTAMDVPTPNTNKLCITLVADYLNGKIGKDNTVGHILEAFRELGVYKRATPVQIQTTISAYCYNFPSHILLSHYPYLLSPSTLDHSYLNGPLVITYDKHAYSPLSLYPVSSFKPYALLT